jgi:hypothetical protein
MRAPRSLLEPAVNAQAKTYEQKIADLVRRLGTDHEPEAVTVVRMLKRLLASQNVTFTDLGDAIEKLANGNLTESAMKQIYDAAYTKGVSDTERKHADAEGAYGLRPDGSTDWEGIALHCQRRKDRIEAKHHQFVDDMASRMTWGREPTRRSRASICSAFFARLAGGYRDCGD